MAERESLFQDADDAPRHHAIQAIQEAHRWLAIWCPHGMDSARSADYHAAADARAALDIARMALEVVRG